MYEAIPDELKQLRQWGLFKLERRGKKIAKLPMNPHDGSLGKSNDPETWGSFEDAMAALEIYPAHGLGFYFCPPYIGIDLDDQADDIERYKNGDHENNMISEFIEMIGSYAEYSVSGRGLHIIARGELPEGGRRKGNVEMYSEGRFFAMTGNAASSYDAIADDDRGHIRFLYEKYIGSPKAAKKAKSESFDLHEDRIIKIAEKSKNGIRFKLFMSGGWEAFYQSPSEADMAFANDLAFWCNRDIDKMDSIFRRSSLFRPKWDEKRKNSTYGIDTLTKAIDECERVFCVRDQGVDDPLIVVDQEIEDVPISYYSFDDTGNAARLKDAFGDIIRYNYQLSSWLYFDGRSWKYDESGFVKSLVDEVVRNMPKEKIYIPEDADPDEMRKLFAKHIKTSRGNRAKTYMLKETEHQVPIMLHELDADPTLFNLRNGYLNLKDGSLHPHDPDKFFSKMASVEIDFRRDCPTWMKFLNDVFGGDQELIGYIQRAVGYSLIGTTEEQKMFILYGNGRNGKSVFLDIISDLFGSYAVNIQPQSLMYQHNQSAGNAASSDIARLDGARFVTTTETNDGLRLDEAKVKQLTGGDRITARFMYSKEFEYKPQFTMWMATNYKPVIRGTDNGIWRRLALIPFSIQIPEDQVDKKLTYKLRREIGSIMRWALEGCLEWQKIGLKEPEIMDRMKDSYRSEMNIIERFIEDRCVRMDGKTVEGDILYQAYKRWALDNTQPLYSSTKFGREMSKIVEKKKHHKVLYQNLRLLSEYERPFLRLSD